MMRASILLAILALGVGLPRDASACSITITPLVFGPYDVFDSSPVDSVGQIRWSCPEGTPTFRISIRGNGRERRLTNGAATLRYGLFLDAARTRPWGDAAGDDEAFVAPVRPGGESGTVTVFGRIHPRQNVTPGAYADVVTITIDL